MTFLPPQVIKFQSWRKKPSEGLYCKATGNNCNVPYLENTFCPFRGEKCFSPSFNLMTSCYSYWILSDKFCTSLFILNKGICAHLSQPNFSDKYLIFQIKYILGSWMFQINCVIFLICVQIFLPTENSEHLSPSSFSLLSFPLTLASF